MREEIEKKEKQDCVLRMIDNLEENCINNGYTSEAERMINHIRNYLVTHLFS